MQLYLHSYVHFTFVNNYVCGIPSVVRVWLGPFCCLLVLHFGSFCGSIPSVLLHVIRMFLHHLYVL